MTNHRFYPAFIHTVQEACKDERVCAFMVEPIQGEAGTNISEIS
jgi:acetylornithine/succinyldiaminopimelate/putrescine aminotransferase